MKINYGINDYYNKFNIDNNDNELDEPQLEIKPNLYLKNIKSNSINNKKNISKKKLGAKKSSKCKAKNKLEKNNNINNNNNDLMNIKKINNFSSSINKRNKSSLKMNNKKNNIISDDDFINTSNQKSYKLNKTMNTNYNFSQKAEEEENNDININNKTFEQKIEKKPLLKQEKESQKNISIGQEQDNSLDNLIIDNKHTIITNNNVYNNFNDVIDLSSHYDFNSNYNYIYGSEMNKSKSVDKKKIMEANLISLKAKPWAYSYYNRDNNPNDIMLKIKKKRPIMNNTERQEFFNNLYNDGKKRKEKYKKLSMEKEAKFNTIYTFTPKILNNRMNEKYLKNMADSKFNANNSNNTSFYNITKNNTMNNTSLITNTNNNYSILNNIKYDTNRNNVGNDLGVVMEENKGEFPIDFMSRLAAYEKIKKSNLEKIKNEVDINMKGNNMYKNKGRTYFNRIPINSIINNTENYFENKQKNLEKIVQTMYEEQGITFQPRTNKSFNGKIKNDVIERNKEFIQDKQKKLEKFSNLREKECTFMPKINTLSTMTILNNSKTGQQSNTSYKTEQGNNSNVSKRLFDYQNKYKEKLEGIRSKYKESYTFKPEISKNTDDILNNKKKIMEQIKENENNLINNIQEGNNEYDISNNNNFMNNNNFNNYNQIIKNNNRNNDLLMKQMKLGELEEISKRISELSEENMIYTEEKVSSQKKMREKKSNNKPKIINEKKQIIFNEHNNSIESNNFQINPSVKVNNINSKNASKINHISNQSSDQILELAKNLLNENISRQKELLNDNDNMDYYYNKKKEFNNDFGSIMMNNNINNNLYNNSKMSISKKKNNAQEYDFDNFKGNKRIMDLNYYDNLL
jgi:hypothetical protein